MMNTELINILGSNGFIAKSLQEVGENFNLKFWSHQNKCESNYFDLFNEQSWNKLLSSNPKIVIILSWPGLTNYNNINHIKTNFPKLVNLIDKLVSVGVKRIIVSGTCYEYGLVCGEINENHITNPVNNYAIAKDCLRKYLFNSYSSTLEIGWLRIFYAYGFFQNQNSLYPQLIKAITNKEDDFKISSGRQIRDFIPVELVSKHLLVLATHPRTHGIYNSGTSRPVSIYDFIISQLKIFNTNLKIKRNCLPDRKDESVAFWANTYRINQLLITYPYTNFI